MPLLFLWIVADVAVVFVYDMVVVVDDIVLVLAIVGAAVALVVDVA